MEPRRAKRTRRTPRYRWVQIRAWRYSSSTARLTVVPLHRLPSLAPLRRPHPRGPPHRGQHLRLPCGPRDNQTPLQLHNPHPRCSPRSVPSASAPTPPPPPPTPPSTTMRGRRDCTIRRCPSSSRPSIQRRLLRRRARRASLTGIAPSWSVFVCSDTRTVGRAVHFRRPRTQRVPRLSPRPLALLPWPRRRWSPLHQRSPVPSSTF
mmetsp:Transcript_22680/g.56895  ORF Transcript_22680/g.56895 Transcript_22680/m.56895 type:complete len:206 (+) Transcript_22680:190-807(+)